jgi:hypothetical protein
MKPGKKEGDIQNIISSIDAGIPVLSFGFIGLPECCIIAGYDDGGEVLLGWSYYPGRKSSIPYQLTQQAICVNDSGMNAKAMKIWGIYSSKVKREAISHIEHCLSVIGEES